MWEFHDFLRRHPYLSGAEVDLAMHLANRLTLADLQYRRLHATMHALVMFLIPIGGTIVVPLFLTALTLAGLAQWVQNDVVLASLAFPLWFLFGWLIVYRWLGRRRFQGNKSKVDRRARIYAGSVNYKLEVTRASRKNGKR
jgi:hypothetical protein